MVRPRRPLLLQDAPDRRAADLDPSTDDVPRDRASAEVTFEAQQADLVHEPPDPSVQTIPWLHADGIHSLVFIELCLLPVADGVGMDHEPCRCLLRRPPSKPHQLEDWHVPGASSTGVFSRAGSDDGSERSRVPVRGAPRRSERDRAEPEALPWAKDARELWPEPRRTRA